LVTVTVTLIKRKINCIRNGKIYSVFIFILNKKRQNKNKPLIEKKHEKVYISFKKI